jgi:hypothetical protein
MVVLEEEEQVNTKQERDTLFGSYQVPVISSSKIQKYNNATNIIINATLFYGDSGSACAPLTSRI